MKNNILITGGELFNKGAQSMTFTVVNEIKKRFPDHNVILLSGMDYNRKKEEKDQYKFEILPLGVGYILELTGTLSKALIRLKNFIKGNNTNREGKSNSGGKSNYKSTVKNLDATLKNAAALIDINGYGLSSQRGYGRSISFLLKIKLAKKYKIKMYIFPQSFGPFNYRGPLKFVLNHMIRKYMKYPEVIYAREQEGLKLLTENYNLKNVKKYHDLVLMGSDIDLSNIYKTLPDFSPKVDIDGVGIVPNRNNTLHGDVDDILDLYDDCINKITGNGDNVYIIRHSYEDLKVCELIKQRHLSNERVILLTDDFNCFEYEEITKNLKFIIASRYHSIVHAYKNYVPCISIGWATKYLELLKLFNQEKYLFDVRNSIDKSAFDKALDDMISTYTIESETIKLRFESVRNENIYDVLEI